MYLGGLDAQYGTTGTEGSKAAQAALS